MMEVLNHSDHHCQAFEKGVDKANLGKNQEEQK